MLETTNKQKLLDDVRDLFDEAVSLDRPWQARAKEAFEFRNNEQWSQVEMDILEEQRRPHLTFNITKAHIDLIMGINEDQRKRYVCTPVSIDDDFRCEVLNSIIFWLYEKNDWADVEDDAFHSAVICGRGWVAIDFELDSNKFDRIKLTEDNIPVHEVRRDPASRKADCSDASYIVWDKWLNVEDFVVKHPKFQKKVEEAFAVGKWPRMETLARLGPEDTDTLMGDIDDVGDYDDRLDIEFYDSKKRQIRVAHMEYWKNVQKYWVQDPKTRDWTVVEGSWKEFQKNYEAANPNDDLVFEKRMTKEVWWVQFCGDEILYHGRSPISYQGFNIIPCFLYGDVSQRSSDHFGIVELMKDAQREINKRVSQTLNLLNQQVQPGLYAEPRAFINKDQAEQSVKEPGSITWLQDGALQNKRFEQRTVPTFPAAIMQMETFAQEIVRRITGINPDLMGQNDKRQEPGIVVQLRQQQGMTILKPVFKAYERMKKELFRRQVNIVTQHMPLSQIMQILGQGDRFTVEGQSVIVDQATKMSCNIRDLRTVEYDIDGEPEQASMTQDMMELATYTEMMKNGFTVDPTVIVSKTNLPATQKTQWIQYIQNQQESQSQQAEQEFALEKQKLDQLHEREMLKIAMETAIADAKIENQREKDFLKTAVDQAKITDTKERDMLNLTLKVSELMHKIQSGNKDAAQKLLDTMLKTKGEQQKMVAQLVDTFVKAKKDVTVAKIQAQAQAQAAKEGKKVSESGHKTGTKSGK